MYTIGIFGAIFYSQRSVESRFQIIGDTNAAEVGERGEGHGQTATIRKLYKMLTQGVPLATACLYHNWYFRWQTIAMLITNLNLQLNTDLRSYDADFGLIYSCSRMRPVINNMMKAIAFIV